MRTVSAQRTFFNMVLLLHLVIIRFPQNCIASSTPEIDWIHIYEVKNPEQLPQLLEASHSIHIHKASKRLVLIDTTATRRTIQYISLPQEIITLFQGKPEQSPESKGELVTRSLSPDQIAFYTTQIEKVPTTLNELLEIYKLPISDVSKLPIKTTESYMIYDLNGLSTITQACAVCPENTDTISVALDRRTGLIHHLINPAQSEAQLLFSYGAPDLKDMYSLGIPSEITAQDRRIPLDIKQITETLSKLQGTAPDHVAILIESEVTTDRSTPLNLTLFAQQQARACYATFSLKDPLTSARLGSDFSKLNEIDIAVITNTLYEIIPTFYYISDGITVWQGVSENESGTTAQPIEQRGLLKDFPIQPEHRISDYLFPVLNHLQLYDPALCISKLDSSARQNELGIRITESELEDASLGQTERIFWLNLKRNYAPVETIEKSYEQSGKTVKSEFRTLFGSFSQYESLWYPTEWLTTASFHSTHSEVRELMREYHLRLFKHQLPVDWFQSFANRFKR